MEFTLKPDGSMAPADDGGETPETAPGGAPAGDADGLIGSAAGGKPAAGADGLIGSAGGGKPAAGADGLIGGAGGSLIKDSDTANFMADVVEASADVPVIVDFWAPWCGPCKQLGPMLEKLVLEGAGMVKLVKINIDENQELAAQMRVQSIPAVYAFHRGQPVDGFMGAVPESQLKAFIGRLTGGAKSPIDTAVDQAKAALEAGDTVTAGAIFAKVQSQDPANADALAGMIRVALAEGDMARAEEIVQALPQDLAQNAEIAAAISALELSREGRESGDVQELRTKLQQDENDHRLRFDLAMALYGAGRNQEAVDELLELVRRDRAWDDEAARKQLVKIFDALGPAHPLTIDGRRRLSSILFS